MGDEKKFVRATERKCQLDQSDLELLLAGESDKKWLLADCPSCKDNFRLLVQASVHPKRAPATDTKSSSGNMLAFLSYLKEAGITPDEDVLHWMRGSSHLLGLLPGVTDVSSAVELYAQACRLPQTATRLVAGQSGLIIDGDLPIPKGVYKGLFIRAFRSLPDATLSPLVIKIPDKPAAAKAETTFYQSLLPLPEDSALVPVELLSLEGEYEKFLSTIPTQRRESDIHRPTTGVLMPQYLLTLADIPSAPSVPCLLKVGSRVLAALKHIHSKGFIHLDVKPSNIFSDGKNWFLGDYGSACKPSSGVVGLGTLQYQPLEMQKAQLSPELDLACLAVSLAEMSGVLKRDRKVVSLEEVRKAISTLPDELQKFISSLLPP